LLPTGLLALGFERHGSEELLKADPISHLYDIYVSTNREAETEMTALIHKARAEKRANGETVEADVAFRAELEAKREEARKKGEEFVEPEEGTEPPPTKAETAWANENSPIHTGARSFFRRMEDGKAFAFVFLELSWN
jgi:hypothetical protein